jgi:hypothetical protein
MGISKKGGNSITNITLVEAIRLLTGLKNYSEDRHLPKGPISELE